MRLRRVAAPLLALTLLATACGGDGGADEASTTTTTQRDRGEAGIGPGGFVPDPIEWAECGGLECATVRVPRDYADLDGPTVQLAVSRTPATGERLGAIFVNPGGPGASTDGFVIGLPIELPDSVGERFDIVGVEPRGVGRSAAFDCGADYRRVYGVDPTVEDDADRTVLVDTARQLAADCARNAGDLLPHVGTRDVARDIDAVRAAMGEPQITYYGASYGTAIGQVYADLFPTRVRAMVLDGIVELGPTGLELAASQAAGFELALGRFAEHCATSGTCETDDVIAAVDEVIAASERLDGIPAPSSSRPAGPGVALGGIAQALYGEHQWAELDAALADALRGDGDGLVRLADRYLAQASFDVYFAVNCIDYAWPTGDVDAFLDAAKAAGRASPRFGEAIVTDYLRCVDWPVPADPLTAVTAPGTPPILVMSTTGDPATPYEAGVNVARTLESGVLITFDGDGHGALLARNSCINALFATYVVDLNVPADGTTCD